MGRKTSISFNLPKYVDGSKECTAKYKNTVSYNTDYIAFDLIYFLGNDWKAIKTQTEERNVYICKKLLY